MVTIAIVVLGHMKHRIDFGRIKAWSSELFTVLSISTRTTIPDGNGNWQEFDDDGLAFVEPVENVDLTVAITEYALQDNYYARPIGRGAVVLSFYEVADILELHDIPLEHFVIRNLYEFAMVVHLYGNHPEGVPDICHDETRSCLFDLNGIKSDVVYSTACPTICERCRARLSGAQLPAGTVHHLEKELARIRKPLYFRMASFIKQRPLLALFIGAVAGLLLDVLGNWAYDGVRLLLAASSP